MADEEETGSRTAAGEQSAHAGARAALLSGYGAIEAAHAQAAAGFSRLMLASLFLLNIGAILGLAVWLPQTDLGSAAGAAAEHALSLFIAAYAAALLAAAAGYWNAALLGLQAIGRRNLAIETLNGAYSDLSSGEGRAMDAQRLRDEAEAREGRAARALLLCWGLGLLGFALTLWGIFAAVEAIRTPPATDQSQAAPVSAGETLSAGALDLRIGELENQLELHPPQSVDQALMERMERLEEQLEMHPPQRIDPPLLERIRRLEAQLEIQPPVDVQGLPGGGLEGGGLEGDGLEPPESAAPTE